MNCFAARFATKGGTPADLSEATARSRSSARLSFGSSLPALSLVMLAACGSDTGTSAGGLGNNGDGGADASGLTTPDGGTVIGTTPDSGGPAPIQCTASVPSEDADKDGFTGLQGDCNDCDKLINPGAYDFPGNAYDEDCSGAPATKEEGACDQGLDMASTSAQDAARAIGLCKFTTADKRDWGVIEARFTTADGSGALERPTQVGLVPKFGVVAPVAGNSLLALSSGVARAPGQDGFTDGCDPLSSSGKTPPAGYPKESSACKANAILGAIFKKDTKVFDQAALEVKIRVPSNANSLGFDSIFYSYEFPDFICTEFNDFYVTFMEPKVSGDGNIVFDSNNDPIGVNTGLLAVCDKNAQGFLSEKKFECPQGTDLLKDTGFGANEYTCGQLDDKTKGPGGASTGWLHTLAPSVAGSIITLRFAIWDTGDNDLDSTVLVDNFTWSVDMPTGASTVAVPILL